MQYTPMPIIVPVETKRDCIVVNNKTYCEDKDLTAKQSGIIILIILFLGIYLVGAFWLADKYDNGLILIGLIVGPLVLLALGLILS